MVIWKIKTRIAKWKTPNSKVGKRAELVFTPGKIKVISESA